LNPLQEKRGKSQKGTEKHGRRGKKRKETEKHGIISFKDENNQPVG
jgi:hypothetical protein